MWRQADCLSFTLNLAQKDCDFFHPQTHSLTSDNNTTGAGVSEAPVLYYFVALLYRLFGNYFVIYRIVNTLLFFLGIFYLFKMLKILFKNSFWAYIIPLFIFASPVVAYYASNFLTDTTAFSLTLIGWYYFFKFKNKTKDKFLYVSFLFFTLAGLLKILSLTSFVAIGIIFLLELFTSLKFNGSKKLFYKNFKHFYPFIILVIIISAWYIYALYYNNIHKTDYFSNKIIPLWSLTFNDIIDKAVYIKNLHFKEYYHPVFFFITFGLFIFNLIFSKKSDKFLITLTFLLFLSNIAISVLWFKAFKDHDYYFLNLIIFPVFNLITFINISDNLNINSAVRLSSKIIITGLLIFLFYDSGQKLHIRYHGWRNNDIKLYEAYTEITPYNRYIGIKRTDTIISIGDITNSYSLTMMNQKGWTQMAGQNKTVKNIKKHIKKGAEYLFVNNEKLLKEKYLQPFIKNKVGSFKNIRIFKLTDTIQ